MKRLIYFGVFVIFYGCAGEKSSPGPSYQISFGEELSLDFGEVGMSSEVPFSISSLDRDNSSFLVFNTFYRRLDTVFFSPGKGRIAPGLEIPKEGPGSIPGFSYFTHTDQRNLFYTLNEIYYLKDGMTIKLKATEVLDDGSGSIKAIVGHGGNREFQSSPLEGDFLVVIIVDHQTQELSLMKYDFENFEKIPFSFDSDQISKHRISFDMGGATVHNAYYPHLAVFDSLLVISYPFMNKISTVRLDGLKQSDFLYESQLVKSQKDTPKESSQIKSLEESIEASSNWRKDVNFGAIQRLNSRMMYRMVGAGEKKNPKLVLELFNNSFEKVGEFNLKAIQTDLKWFHITVEGKILIQSWKDPDEDIFKYYLVSVDPV